MCREILIFVIFVPWPPFTQHALHIFSNSNFRCQNLDNQSEYRKSPTHFLLIEFFPEGYPRKWELTLTPHHQLIQEGGALQRGKNVDIAKAWNHWYTLCSALFCMFWPNIDFEVCCDIKIHLYVCICITKITLGS